MIGLMKNPSFPVGNRTHDIPACSAVPYLTMPANHDLFCNTHEETQFFTENINAIEIYKELLNSTKILFWVHNYGNFTFRQRL
jgi:hypothetical protein